uniref:Uncharacterized protein n=1 Tax=Rhizophagus irregularis (strain DAOM 181602 / DAOM 197198 / MUCL 43194) TaxID=747089 RepID=U9SPN3_RHIID
MQEKNLYVISIVSSSSFLRYLIAFVGSSCMFYTLSFRKKWFGKPDKSVYKSKDIKNQ